MKHFQEGIESISVSLSSFFRLFLDDQMNAWDILDFVEVGVTVTVDVDVDIVLLLVDSL